MKSLSRNTHFLLACLLCGFWLLGSTESYAQNRQSPRQPVRQSFRDRPRVSPYTSLINNGNGSGAALNYFNIVRPRKQAAKVARSLSTQLQAAESNIQALKRSPATQATTDSEPVTTGRMRATGHPTAFGYLGDFYTDAQQSR